jgi:hypothetical protein
MIGLRNRRSVVLVRVFAEGYFNQIMAIASAITAKTWAITTAATTRSATRFITIGGGGVGSGITSVSWSAVNKSVRSSDQKGGGCRTEHHSENLQGSDFEKTVVLGRTCHDQNGKPTKILISTGVHEHRPIPPKDGCAGGMLIVTSAIGWRHSADGAGAS